MSILSAWFASFLNFILLKKIPIEYGACNICTACAYTCFYCVFCLVVVLGASVKSVTAEISGSQ